MKHRHKLLICLLFILSLFFPLFGFAVEVTPYPGVMHIHSRVSTGDYSLREITRNAQVNGAKILIFTDSFLRRWEYPSFIFPNILKISGQENSVVKYGIKRYLQDIDKIRLEFPGMVILAGVEVAPFYWWSGSIFKNNLCLNDGNKHLLVILNSYEDYAGLPVICNRYFLPKLKDLPVFILSLFLVFLGLFLLKKANLVAVAKCAISRHSEPEGRTISVINRSFPFLFAPLKVRVRMTKKDISQQSFDLNKSVGVILCAAGIFLFLQNFPFSTSKYNSQQGYKKYLPYQELIDYVNKKNGLVFWAHPEVSDFWKIDRKFGGVNLYTAAYPQALSATVAYSGFGIGVGASKNELVLAGNQWDQVLVDYCQGKRGDPAWIFGELDYRRGKIGALENIFFLPEFKADSVAAALKNGKAYLRFYAEGSMDISLRDFYIQDSQDSSVVANVADEIKVLGNSILHIKGTCQLSPEQEIKVQIIRDGEVVKELEFNSAQKEFDFQLQDNALQGASGKSYYRLNFFCGNNVVLVTNPIFVSKIGVI